MNFFKSKQLSVFLVLTLLLFIVPAWTGAQETQTGIIIGHVFFEDGTTPVQGAVVMVKKTDSDLNFESLATDENGAFRIENVVPGMYVAGVIYKEKNYNVNNVIGTRPNESIDVVLIIQESDKAPLLAFFTSAAGLAIIAASTVAVTFAILASSGEEDAATVQRIQGSPYK